MRLPLWTTRGLSDFQIDFIKQNTLPTKEKSLRDHAKSLFWWVLYGGTAAGLWCQHLYPEDTPETVVNFTTFGVWFVMICAFFAAIFLGLFLLAAVASTVGFEGVKGMAKKENVVDDDGDLVADKMSAMAHKFCKSLLPSFRWNPAIFLTSLIQDALTLAFFSGLIVTGWTFFAVCYFFIWSLKALTGRLMRGLVVSHVKGLTPERVRLLTELGDKFETSDNPRIIEAHIVDVNRNEDGELEAEHTETVRFRPDAPRDA